MHSLPWVVRLKTVYEVFFLSLLFLRDENLGSYFQGIIVLFSFDFFDPLLGLGLGAKVAKFDFVPGCLEDDINILPL